jgi:Leucine-rich repeat (LRR) protein
MAKYGLEEGSFPMDTAGLKDFINYQVAADGLTVLCLVETEAHPLEVILLRLGVHEGALCLIPPLPPEPSTGVFRPWILRMKIVRPEGIVKSGAGRDVAIAALKGLGGDVTANSVGFRGSKVGDGDLVHLKALGDLTKVAIIDCPKVTGAGLAHLAGLKELRTLYLPYTSVDDSGLAHLKGLTKLQNLYLVGTKVTDAGLKQLSELRNLNVLYLDETTVEDVGLGNLKRLGRLVDLSLNQTGVTDEGLASLKSMKNLRYLRLKDTKVSAVGVKKLRKSLPDCEISYGGTRY